jgi:hydroxyacylglutathione hydrolase
MALAKRLSEVQAARQQQESTVPSELGIEKQINPFLRWDTAALQASASSTDPVQTFARIRGMKDQF